MILFSPKLSAEAIQHILWGYNVRPFKMNMPEGLYVLRFLKISHDVGFESISIATKVCV